MIIKWSLNAPVVAGKTGYNIHGMTKRKQKWQNNTQFTDLINPFKGLARPNIFKKLKIATKKKIWSRVKRYCQNLVLETTEI